MNAEILVNITPSETRVARLEDGILVDIAIERVGNRSLVGNIYNGKVVRVMPGMQAAFVEIGLDKAGFIHANDIMQSAAPGGDPNSAATPDIRQLLREGQVLPVQVIKEPISSKGARLSTHLSVSSRYLVYMPGVDHVGISQRIEKEDERQRLRTQLDLAIDAGGMKEEGGGYIIRTVADGVAEDEFLTDVDYLHRLWGLVKDKMTRLPARTCIYHDLPLSLRVMRDVAAEEVARIRVDSIDIHKQMCRFTENFSPEMLEKLEYYEAERPIFSLFGVEDEIDKSLERKVKLKSGGYLIFDQTEAMTTIDVNTGGFVGHRNLGETIYTTNLEAASAIARQLRLRNLGGIIILDFIDMKDLEHRRQVMRRLEKELELDHVKMKVTGVSELGLVEMTRKRTSESLQRLLCEPCENCQGRGFLKSVETTSFSILREIVNHSGTEGAKKRLVLASPAVVERILDQEAAYLSAAEQEINCPIEFRTEGSYSQEQYDIITV